MSTFRERSVPLWAVVIGLGFILGGFVTCQQHATKMAADPAQWLDTLGKPLDHVGDRPFCHVCGQGSMAEFELYRYRCENCGVVCTLKRDLVNGGVCKQCE